MEWRKNTMNNQEGSASVRAIINHANNNPTMQFLTEISRNTQ